MTAQVRVARVLDFADRTLGESAAAAVRELRARLREPLRVAIAGRVKAGKSTLLNALVGERLAATDAGEATRVVTWYVRDDSYSVRAVAIDGSERPVRFTREDGRLILDPRDVPDDGGSLRVGWPSARLREMVLIDTPGIGSLTPGIADRTVDALHAAPNSVGVADAVVYLMRHLHPTDIGFLEAFLGAETDEPTPVNSVAVLSRADEIGAGRLDAMASAAVIADRYARDERVRSLASAVVPVSGLIAETAATLQEREAEALRMLGVEDAAVVDRMLLATDLWREPGVSPLSVDIRGELLDRFGVFGLRVTIDGLRRASWSTASELARLLSSVSGLPKLHDVVRQRFAGRSRQLVARSVLASLRGVVARQERSAATDAVLRLIEETEGAAHEFAELRVLDLVWSRMVELSDDEVAELERVTGAGSAATRLGQPQISDATELRAAAARGAARWRARAGDARSDPLATMCAETIARTYEGLYAEMAIS